MLGLHLIQVSDDHENLICYKASIWIRVGQTQGRGRNDITHKKLETIKGIYVYPLVRNFRQRMGVTEATPPSLAVDDGIEHDSWAQNEFGGAEKIVLSIQDGTDLNFTSLAQCEGLGSIGKNQTGASSKGLHLHSTFVVNTDGLPLGVLRGDCSAPQTKNENSSTQDKKTRHWIDATHDCSALAQGD